MKHRQHCWTASADNNHRRVTKTDSSRRWKQAARRVRWRGGRQLRESGTPEQMTPAVTMSGSMAACMHCSNYVSRPTRYFLIPGMAHHMEMLTYAEYAHAATNVRLHQSEGAKVLKCMTPFKEATLLPEATRREGSFGQGNGGSASAQSLRPPPHRMHTTRAKSDQLTVSAQTRSKRKIR